MSEIFGAIGSIAAASIQSNAIKDVAKRQVEALEKQRAFVFEQLNPAVVGGQATAADIDRAKNRLALQGVLDPTLLRSRYAAEAGLEQSLAGLGKGTAEDVAAKAASEALGTTGDFDALKKRLIDTALSEIDAGASLPPDLQAELVKSGLETGSRATGSSNPAGLAGNETRRLIGKEGLELQASRQGRAAALGQAAQSLEANRANILGSLFPALKQNQLATAQGQAGIFDLANKAVPEAGLGGSDIANIWLARVGATNQLAQSSADAAARGAFGQAQAISSGIGGATSALGNALPSTGSVFNSIFGSKAPASSAAGSFTTANMN
jgi:hypothetical protein